MAQHGITLFFLPGVGYQLQTEDEKKYQQLKAAFRQSEYRHYFDVPEQYHGENIGNGSVTLMLYDNGKYTLSRLAE